VSPAVKVIKELFCIPEQKVLVSCDQEFAVYVDEVFPQYPPKLHTTGAVEQVFAAKGFDKQLGADATENG
jgi:hypothetical protein